MTKNEPLLFYNIPANDFMIGAYAAYYIGLDRDIEDAENAAENVAYNFNFRATNPTSMLDIMKDAFVGENSPWVLIDHRSNQDKTHGNLHGAHLITLYHKQSQQIVIAMPGFEPESSPLEMLQDLKQITFMGVCDQSRALHQYATDVETLMGGGTITDSKGHIHPVTNKKPLICAHSMGTIAGQMMALDGYQTLLIEPRPVHDNLLNQLQKNMLNVTGKSLNHDDMIARLTHFSITVRARHGNVWNSLIAPWKKAYKTGETYSYCNNDKPRIWDRFITTFHRLECVVPSLLDTPKSRLSKLYNGKMFLRPHPSPNIGLIDEIIENTPPGSQLRRLRRHLNQHLKRA